MEQCQMISLGTLVEGQSKCSRPSLLKYGYVFRIFFHNLSQPETQEITSQPLDQSFVDENVWGRLLSLRNNLEVYNLVEDHYSFGRGNVTYQFSERFLGESLLSTTSKLHFQIYRQYNSRSEAVTIIEDNSQNGTYINKVKVGKNVKKVLKNNDEISVSLPKSKVFIYYDCFNNDAINYPPALSEKYTITKKLGHGTYGEVRLAYSQGSLQRVAIKIVEKKILSARGTTVLANNISQIKNEVKLLQSVDHPCIVKLLDIIECPEKIYIVMELAEGGELFDRIVDSKRLKEPIAKMYFYQLVHAVSYLHKKKITHRDIKPENILLKSEDEYTTIKLTDFGLSKLTHDATIMKTLCGTPTYIAPELLTLGEGERCYDSKVDVWSLGVVLFVSLAGYPPFTGRTDPQTQFNIINGCYKMREEIFANVSEDAKDLITKLLVVDPSIRPTAEEILEHKWLQRIKMKYEKGQVMEMNEIDSVNKIAPLEASHWERPAAGGQKNHGSLKGIEVDQRIKKVDSDMIMRAENLMDIPLGCSPPKRRLEDDSTIQSDKTPKLMNGVEFDFKS